MAVAIKLEPFGKHRLVSEYRVYRSLNEGDVGEGFAKVEWFGVDSGRNVLVMNLLGPSLDGLLQKCGGMFTLKTTLMLAEQCITRLEVLHSKSYIHRYY